MPKRYILFAGVNGAGKTTLYQANPQIKDMPRINLDEIVRSIGSWKNPADVHKAGMQAVRLIDSYFKEGVSFNQETTLCGNAVMKYIRRAKNEGYEIELHYVGLDSSEIAKERIRQRVRDGGHGVSDADIERRYAESFEKLKTMPSVCDRIYLYDNTNRFVRIASFKNGEWMSVVNALPKWVSLSQAQ